MKPDISKEVEIGIKEAFIKALLKSVGGKAIYNEGGNNYKLINNELKKI